MIAFLAMGGLIFIAAAVAGLIADRMPQTPDDTDFQGDDEL